MERKYARFIGFGLLIGIAVGISVGQSAFAVALGALGGVFLGWFVAAIQMQRNSDHTPTSHQTTEPASPPVGRRNAMAS